MKVNHSICKYCIYSQYSEENYVCIKKDCVNVETLENEKFDCPYRKEF